LTFYKLNDYLREDFRRPLGVLVKNSDLESHLGEASLDDRSLLTVGDRTTEYFVARGMRPALQIVDALEKRAKRTAPVGGFDRMTSVSNPAGGIEGEAMELIRTELKKGGPARILVKGEEDLLVLPAILFAAEGMDVFYGQPNEGMVHVKVSPEAKKKVAGLLSLMGYQASPP
jgi:hypothetical protein